MARKIVIVCDTCSSEEGVQTFEVRHEGEKGKADLCQEHGAPLLAVVRGAGTAPAPELSAAAAARAAKRKEARERRAAERAVVSA